MADFLVALLSTSVILLLSYLFWKWHTQRNNVTNEGKNRPALSWADMLKNRLKRFEARAFDDDESSVQVQKGPKNQSINAMNASEDMGDIAENQGFRTQGDSVDTELNTINLPGILNTHNSGSRNEGIQDQSSAYKPAAKNKPANSNDISAPVTQPLTNLDELLAWTEGFDELNVSSVSLGRVGNSLERRPRTIVCHDMKGGYVMYRIDRDQVADQLGFFAKYYGFDGWLINIENPIQPAQMNNLVEFMKYLTDRIHKVMPCSLIIWYGNVTNMSELKWQNELNAENRGVYGGGGWNTNKYGVFMPIVPLTSSQSLVGQGYYTLNFLCIKENDLSAALFAPGWVYPKYKSTFKSSQDKYYLLAEKDLKGSHIKEIRLVLMNKTIPGSKMESSSTPFQLYLGEVKRDKESYIELKHTRHNTRGGKFRPQRKGHLQRGLAIAQWKSQTSPVDFKFSTSIEVCRALYNIITGRHFVKYWVTGGIHKKFSGTNDGWTVFLGSQEEARFIVQATIKYCSNSLQISSIGLERLRNLDIQLNLSNSRSKNSRKMLVKYWACHAGNLSDDISKCSLTIVSCSTLEINLVFPRSHVLFSIEGGKGYFPDKVPGAEDKVPGGEDKVPGGQGSCRTRFLA
ncbi:cytosolic endo-beta-N-acetylglucosaminidase, partial [Paramuricea clavata]